MVIMIILIISKNIILNIFELTLKTAGNVLYVKFKHIVNMPNQTGLNQFDFIRIRSKFKLMIIKCLIIINCLIIIGCR